MHAPSDVIRAPVVKGMRCQLCVHVWVESCVLRATSEVRPWTDGCVHAFFGFLKLNGEGWITHHGCSNAL
jgi:hypothetical protein